MLTNLHITPPSALTLHQRNFGADSDISVYTFSDKQAFASNQLPDGSDEFSQIGKTNTGTYFQLLAPADKVQLSEIQAARKALEKGNKGFEDFGSTQFIA